MLPEPAAASSDLAELAGKPAPSAPWAALPKPQGCLRKAVHPCPPTGSRPYFVSKPKGPGNCSPQRA